MCVDSGGEVDVVMLFDGCGLGGKARAALLLLSGGSDLRPQRPSASFPFGGALLRCHQASEGRAIAPNWLS